MLGSERKSFIFCNCQEAVERGIYGANTLLAIAEGGMNITQLRNNHSKHSLSGLEMFEGRKTSRKTGVHIIQRMGPKVALRTGTTWSTCYIEDKSIKQGFLKFDTPLDLVKIDARGPSLQYSVGEDVLLKNVAVADGSPNYRCSQQAEGVLRTGFC